MSTKPLLRLKQVVFEYSYQNKKVGVKGVSFSVQRGEFIALVGASGSGKTTLMKCIYGLKDVQKGIVLFEGNQVYGPSRNLIPGHKRMKLVSQDYDLHQNHTVYENLDVKFFQYFKSVKHARIMELLRLVNLDSMKNKTPHELSGGQQQRLSIARALAEMPDLLLLDEPFANLDIPIKEKILEYIVQKVKEDGLTCLFVTHDAKEALRLADRIAVMDKGKVIQLDYAQEVYHKPKHKLVAQLFGKLNELDHQLFDEFKPVLERDGKYYYRPEQFGLVEDRAGEWQVQISRFCGWYYEVSLTNSEMEIVVYHHHEMAESVRCRLVMK